MDDYVAEVISRDDQNDIGILVDYIRSRPLSVPELPGVFQRLLEAGRIRAAFIVAKHLENYNLHLPAASIARCVGDLLYGSFGDSDRTLALLGAEVDLLHPDVQAHLYASTLAPIIPLLLNLTAEATDRNQAFLKLMALLKALVPAFREVFDLETAPLPFDLAAHRERGRARFSPLHQPWPPEERVRVPRRAVVAARERWFHHDPNSRLHDIGPRIATAMGTYGWPAVLCAMVDVNPEGTYRAIGELCVQYCAEILVLDADLMVLEGYRQAQAGLIAYLRQALPALKIVAMHLDLWAVAPPLLQETGALADAIWALAPKAAVWEDPVFTDKVVHLQVPHAGTCGPPALPLRPRLLFAGGIKGYNLHRMFWMAASAHLGLPIDWRLSSHDTDGITALESYAIYMRELAEATCCLNFSMRPNQTRIITGRMFETILSGSLLVQEAAPDNDCFFQDGAHYLGFTSLSELRSIAAFIVERPEEAEEIRQAGYTFARAHYSDDRLIGALDWQVFGRERPRAG